MHKHMQASIYQEPFPCADLQGCMAIDQICVYMYTCMHVQWKPEMRTPAGRTLSVLIIEVSFIQGLELFNVTCLGPRDNVQFVEVSVFRGVRI